MPWAYLTCKADSSWNFWDCIRRNCREFRWWVHSQRALETYHEKPLSKRIEKLLEVFCLKKIKTSMTQNVNTSHYRSLCKMEVIYCRYCWWKNWRNGLKRKTFCSCSCQTRQRENFRLSKESKFLIWNDDDGRVPGGYKIFADYASYMKAVSLGFLFASPFCNRRSTYDCMLLIAPE